MQKVKFTEPQPQGASIATFGKIFHVDILANETITQEENSDNELVTYYIYDRTQFTFTPGIITADMVRANPAAFIALEGNTDSLYDQIVNTVQEYMDSFAKSKGANRNYDTVQSAITYRGDPNPVFAAEAEAFFQFRSAVWTHVRALQAKATKGDMDSVAALLALPAGLPEPDFSNVPNE